MTNVNDLASKNYPFEFHPKHKWFNIIKKRKTKDNNCVLWINFKIFWELILWGTLTLIHSNFFKYKLGSQIQQEVNGGKGLRKTASEWDLYCRMLLTWSSYCVTTSCFLILAIE